MKIRDDISLPSAQNTLELLALSIDTLMLLELLLLLCFLACAGSTGVNPDDRANRFKMSVRETTPVRRPESRAPGAEEAETEGNGSGMVGGEVERRVGGGSGSTGVAGMEEEGEGVSTTHILFAIRFD